jgi:hypothetical protein
MPQFPLSSNGNVKNSAASCAEDELEAKRE